MPSILKHCIFRYWDLDFTNNINFQSFEVVCRGSETQLQVTEVVCLSWLKGLAQAKIIKKSVILFRVLNMTI